MTPINTSTSITTQGCSSAAGKQTSILSFMSSSMSQPINSTVSKSLIIPQKNQKNLQHQSTICTVPQPPVSTPLIISTKSQKNQHQSINKSNLKQPKIYEYLTPAYALLQIENPSRPIKAQHPPRRLVSSSLNLHAKSFADMPDSALPANTIPPVFPIPSLVKWRQVPITSFFAAIPSTPTVNIPPPLPLPNKAKPKRTSVRRTVLQYSAPPKRKNRITRYTTSMPTYDLFDSWGHSLETIDANSTFRIFLQKPNGLSVYRNNHLLVQDLQTCYNYGAGALCFPETNTNWNQDGQLFTLSQLFRGVWNSSLVQPSQTPEPFLSNHQPGGTLTAVCENWVSRVIAKGEDPYGLGRWSYVTLRGKQSTKITIVTACYSVSRRSYILPVTIMHPV